MGFLYFPARMDCPTTIETEKISRARSLADGRAWVELLEFAKVWQGASVTSAKALFFQGVALGGQGRFLEAATAYQRALALDAKDFKAWNNLGQILFEELRRPRVRPIWQRSPRESVVRARCSLVR